MGVAWVFLCLLAACNQRPPAADVITVAVLSSPNNLDPRIGSDETSQRVHQLVFDYLLALDDKLRVTGGLATHWEQPNPLTYVVYLRKGVRFHDGHELTADDVVHTFGSFIDPSFISPRKGAYRMLDRVEAVDPLHGSLQLKEPFGSFPIQLVMPVVPKGAGPELRDRPIGTGPYKFVSFAVDDHVTLEAFPDYFRGAPANRGVVLKVDSRRDHARARTAQGHRRHGGERPVARRRASAGRGKGRHDRRGARAPITPMSASTCAIRS